MGARPAGASRAAGAAGERVRQTRILGLQNEYGLISSSLGGKLNLSVESALGYLFEKVVSRQRGTNDFLRNGARPRQDPGCHPEHGTAERDHPLGLVIHV